MKKFFVIAAMAALALVSCNKTPKEEEPVQKNTIDDIAIVDGALSFSINGVEGTYYAGAMKKADFENLASLNGDGLEGYPMAIVQLCGAGMMQSPDAKEVNAPATANFAITMSYPMFGVAGAAFDAGETYIIFIIPKATADENDKDTFDKIVWIEYKA